MFNYLKNLEMNLLCIGLKYQRLSNSYKLYSLNQISRLLSTTSDFSQKRQIQIKPERLVILSNPMLRTQKQSLIIRQLTTQKETKEEAKKEENEAEKPKKQSKFKQFYSQYGPLFLVVHFTTVVLWIYFFFLISKQYVITLIITCNF